VTTGAVIGLRLTQDGDPVNAVTFSPDGAYLAAGSENGQLYFWQTENEALLQRLDGHPNGVLSLQFSPDGSLLASAGKDGQVLLWDVTTGRQLGQPFGGFSDWVSAVRFADDGSTLTAGSLDGRILRWSVSPDEWRDYACQIANRNFTSEEWTAYFSQRPYYETCKFLATLTETRRLSS
jgi:WD40 repeat protein